MKKTALFLIASLALAGTSQATISQVSSVTYTTSPSSPIRVDTVLQSFTTQAGGSFSSYILPSSISTIAGTEWLWPLNGTNPGSVSNALLDNDIISGALNPGSTAIYHFSGLNAGDTIFAFANYGGDNPSSVIAVDGGGANIGSSLILPNLTVDIASTELNRSTSGTLNRTVRGITFQVSDFDLGGAPISSIAGIRFGNASFDVNMVGLVAVPEPGAYALLAGVVLLVFAAKRRRLFS